MAPLPLLATVASIGPLSRTMRRNRRVRGKRGALPAGSHEWICGYRHHRNGRWGGPWTSPSRANSGSGLSSSSLRGGGETNRFAQLDRATKVTAGTVAKRRRKHAACLFRLTVPTLQQSSGRRRWASGPRGTLCATRSVVHGKGPSSSASSNDPLVHRRSDGRCRGECANPDTPESRERAGWPQVNASARCRPTA